LAFCAFICFLPPQNHQKLGTLTHPGVLPPDAPEGFRKKERRLLLVIQLTQMVCCVGGDAKMEVEGEAPAAAIAVVEEDEQCFATYQLTGVLTHKVGVFVV